jgi:hypothetical protein
MKRVLFPSTFAMLAGALSITALMTFSATEAAAASRHVVRPDAAGGATASNMRGVRGPDGGYAARAGTTSVNPDGSASHRSGFAASGARGNVESSGSATRDASGNVT